MSVSFGQKLKFKLPKFREIYAALNLKDSWETFSLGIFTS